jgi:hypothetical protein
MYPAKETAEQWLDSASFPTGNNVAVQPFCISIKKNTVTKERRISKNGL